MKKLILILAALPLFAQPSYTTIQDTLQPGASGKAVTGSIVVSWTEFTNGASTIAPSPAAGVAYPIVNGAVSIPLIPTDQGAAAGTAYKVVTTIGGQAVTTYWAVPTLPSGQCSSSSVCVVKEVTVAYPGGTPVNPPYSGTLNYVVKGAGTTAQVVTSNCSVTGAANADLSCPSSVSVSDLENPGALDLSQPGGNTTTITIPASNAAYVIELPAAVPDSTGLALKVSSISTTTVNGISVPLVVLAWE